MRYILLSLSLLALFSNAFSQIPNYVPTAGLVGFWTFDGNGNDQAGGNTLTAVGAVSYTTDRFGNANKAALFDAASEYFSKVSPVLPSGNTSRSLSMWYYGSGTIYNAFGQQSPFMYGDLVNGTCYLRFGFLTNATLNQVEYQGRCNPRTDALPAAHLNAWQHIVYTLDGPTNTLALYQNGVLVNSTVLPGSHNTSLGELRIGSGMDNQNPNGNAAQFDGKIDEVAFYDRVLTTQEIKQLSQNCNLGSTLAASNNPVCTSSILRITASDIGTSYIWTGPNGFTSNDTVAIINPVSVLSSGVYSVKTVTQGCTSTVANTISIVVNASPTAPALTTNAPVCENGTLNLFATAVAGATYYWQGPGGYTANTQNTSINPVLLTNAGIFSVQTIANGCSSQVITQNVTVNAIPAAPVISSNTPVCTGGVLSFTASGPSGANYSWTGPNAFAANTQNPVISSLTVAATGIYSATSIVNSCSSPVATLTVNVLTSPAPITPSSNSPICEGLALNLTATSAGAGTYIWEGPNSYTSNQQEPVLMPALANAAGVYTLYAFENGCRSAGTTLNVQIQPAPVIPSVGSNSPVCSGTTLYITSGTVAGATYEWYGPNGYTSANQNDNFPLVTTMEAGQYTVYATASGCVSLGDTVNVVVLQTPSAPVAGVNSPVCAGDVINFSSSDGAGAAYVWSSTNGFSSTDQNPFIGFAALTDNGVYQLRLVENGCTSAVATVTVVVNSRPPNPTLQVNSPVCGTQTLNLQASSIPSAVYTWTGPDGFTAITQNPSIAGMTQAQAGVYTLEVTVNGCSSGEDTVSVQVVDVPLGVSALSNSPVCVGDSLILSMSGLVQGQFTWKGPGNFSSGLPLVKIPAAYLPHSGTYQVLYHSSQCTVSLASINVVVNPAPTPPVISMVSGFLTSSQPTNIQWYYNNQPLSGATLPTLNPSLNGYYSVKFTSPTTGCSSFSQAYFYMTQFVGMDDDQYAHVFSMYPNPAAEYLTLRTDLPFEQEDAKLEITDVNGRVVYTEALPLLQKSEIRIPLSRISPGMYIVRIIGSQLMIQQRLIKQ